jgi:hypothetical protein
MKRELVSGIGENITAINIAFFYIIVKWDFFLKKDRDKAEQLLCGRSPAPKQRNSLDGNFCSMNELH